METSTGEESPPVTLSPPVSPDIMRLTSNASRDGYRTPCRARSRTSTSPSDWPPFRSSSSPPPAPEASLPIFFTRNAAAGSRCASSARSTAPFRGKRRSEGSRHPRTSTSASSPRSSRPSSRRPPRRSCSTRSFQSTRSVRCTSRTPTISALERTASAGTGSRSGTREDTSGRCQHVHLAREDHSDCDPRAPERLAPPAALLRG
jgi:hypothetical protein